MDVIASIADRFGGVIAVTLLIGVPLGAVVIHKLRQRRARDRREGEPAEEPSTRQNLVLVFVLGSVLLTVVVGVVVGGISWVVDAVKPPDGCGTNGYCHNDDLAAIETYTGYDFSAGSGLLDSSVGRNNFTNEWSAVAHVALPPGSPLPTSSDQLSEIHVTGADDRGRTLVEVFTSDGKQGFPG